MTSYWFEQNERDLPGRNDWLSSSELLQFEQFRIPKRRSDWRLGRWTAKRAVAIYLRWPQNSESLQRIEIASGSSGAPWVRLPQQSIAPSISLTHRGGVAACVVTSADTVVGCDLELIEPRSAAFVEDYFTTDEQAMIEQTGKDVRDLLITLLWSAKESALKALQCGLRVDTRSLSVSLSGASSVSTGSSSREFAVDPLTYKALQTGDWTSLSVRLMWGQFLHGWWRAAGAVVRTVVTTALSASAPLTVSLS